MSRKSITVLPFVNMSDSQENEYFSDGITEEIINALAKIKDLKVTSRTSAFSFKGKNVPIREIGKQLNVSVVLEGSVRLSGDLMRITAQLIDVSSDFHFWSETFDRQLINSFAIQDEVSLLIADKLREHLGHFELDDHLVDSFDIPVAVYKKYLKGRFHLMKLDYSETLKSVKIFQEVITEAPGFPLPYLCINQGYSFLGTMGLIPAIEAFVKAQPFLDKAIELAEYLPETQLNLSWRTCWQNWDLKSAYKHLNNALEGRPTDEMYLTMSNFLTVEGKLEAAFNYIRKALELDPFSAMNHHYKGFLYYLSEQYDDAIVWLNKSLELNPGLPFPPLYIGECMLLSGKAKEALTYFESLSEHNKEDLTKLGGTTLSHIALGNTAKALEGIAELSQHLESESAGRAATFLIFCKTSQGKFEEAIELIRQGISNRLPTMLLLYTEPMTKSLRQHPKFQELMREILGDSTSFGPKRKYKKSLFPDNDLEQYKEQLSQLMLTEKPYLDVNLTLRTLAAQLQITPNQLSQLLNEGFNKNFSEFINTNRLEAFKEKIAKPKLQHLTILALAYESGFNSKTVFNTYFKKIMGMTPKAYWNNVVGK